MRISILLYLALAINTVFGQEKEKQKKLPRFSIGVNFSPDYCFRTLKNNDGSSSSALVVRTRNDIESAKFGYTTGVCINLNFSTVFSLETGIQYSNKGYISKSQTFVILPNDPVIPANEKVIYSYHYIGIPLKARLDFGNSKTRFFAGAGFTTSVLVNEAETFIYTYPGGRTTKNKQSSTMDFKKLDISPLISLGIDFKITDKIRWVAEPIFRFGILNTTDTPVTEKLWNMGLNIAAYYRL
jgi:hypothetical protein